MSFIQYSIAKMEFATEVITRNAEFYPRIEEMLLKMMRELAELRHVNETRLETLRLYVKLDELDNKKEILVSNMAELKLRMLKNQLDELDEKRKMLVSNMVAAEASVDAANAGN